MLGSKILIIGDSFVEGVGAESLDKGWAQQLSSAIGTQSVEISGIGGDNINKLLARFPDRSFDTYIIQVGTNDSRYRPSLKQREVEISEFKKGIVNLVKKIRKINERANVVFIGLMFVDESKTVPYKEDKIYLNDSIKEYSELLKSLASSYGVHFIEIVATYNESSLLEDGLHPSQSGHNLIFNSVVSFLKLNVENGVTEW